jgi:A/G-specific adenine glycosylase
MLQQTQTERVVPKYLAFLGAFPTPAALARGTVAELLALWSGLGYNRRALALKRSAEAMVERHGGELPDSEEGLLDLPGVGPYTARAVQAFAWGRPVVLIETNIRSVFIHRFIAGTEGVADASLLPLIEAALDRQDPRNWYYALMDYGAALKKTVGNPSRKSASYAKQSPFADSHRRVRGALLKALASGPGDAEELAAGLPFARERVDKALAELVAEGFVERYEGGVRLVGATG